MSAKARRRAEKRPVEDTVPYRPPHRPNDIRVIGAHADYRREDFIFARTQSPQLRELEWENNVSRIVLTRGSVHPRTPSTLHLVHKQLLHTLEGRVPGSEQDI